MGFCAKIHFLVPGPPDRQFYTISVIGNYFRDEMCLCTDAQQQMWDKQKCRYFRWQMLLEQMKLGRKTMQSTCKHNSERVEVMWDPKSTVVSWIWDVHASPRALWNQDWRGKKEETAISRRKWWNMEHFKFSFQKKHPELHFTDFINNPAVLAAGGAVGRLLHVQMENPQPQQELLVLEAPREEDDQRKDGNQTKRS